MGFRQHDLDPAQMRGATFLVVRGRSWRVKPLIRKIIRQGEPGLFAKQCARDERVWFESSISPPMTICRLCGTEKPIRRGKVCNQCRNSLESSETKEKRRVCQRRHSRTWEGRFQHLQRQAARRDIICTLDLETFKREADKPCVYCGNELGAKTITAGGLDRIDNSKGYEAGNVAACCNACNMIKGYTLTSEETKTAVEAIIAERELLTLIAYIES